MEQIPSWKSSSASQKFPYILRIPKIYCRLHKNLSLFHILSHIDPAHALPTDFFKVRFSIILQSTV